MLEFFVERAYLEHRGWNLIFYTGSEPLIQGTVEQLEATHVCLIQDQPDLETLIPNLIYGIESGKGLPEKYLPDKKDVAIAMLAEKLASWMPTTMSNCPPKTRFMLSLIHI